MAREEIQLMLAGKYNFHQPLQILFPRDQMDYLLSSRYNIAVPHPLPPYHPEHKIPLREQIELSLSSKYNLSFKAHQQPVRNRDELALLLDARYMAAPKTKKAH